MSIFNDETKVKKYRVWLQPEGFTRYVMFDMPDCMPLVQTREKLISEFGHDFVFADLFFTGNKNENDRDLDAHKSLAQQNSNLNLQVSGPIQLKVRTGKSPI